MAAHIESLPIAAAAAAEEPPLLPHETPLTPVRARLDQAICRRAAALREVERTPQPIQRLQAILTRRGESSDGPQSRPPGRS
jgi:hypothetical protein